MGWHRAAEIRRLQFGAPRSRPGMGWLKLFVSLCRPTVRAGEGGGAGWWRVALSLVVPPQIVCITRGTVRGVRPPPRPKITQFSIPFDTLYHSVVPHRITQLSAVLGISRNSHPNHTDFLLLPWYVSFWVLQETPPPPLPLESHRFSSPSNTHHSGYCWKHPTKSYFSPILCIMLHVSREPPQNEIIVWCSCKITWRLSQATLHPQPPPPRAVVSVWVIILHRKQKQKMVWIQDEGMVACTWCFLAVLWSADA